MRLKFYLIGLGTGVIVTAVIMGIALGSRRREMTDEEIMARARQLGMSENVSSSLAEAAGVNNGESSYVFTQPEAQNVTGAENTRGEEASEGAQDSAAGNAARTDGSGTEGADASLVITGEALDADGNAADGSGGGAASGEDTDAADRGESADGDAQNGTQSAQGAAPAPDDTESAGADTQDGDAAAGSNGGNADGAQNVAGGGQQAAGSIVVTIPDGTNSEDVCELLESAGVVDSARALNNYLVQNGSDRYISPGAKLIPRGSTYEEISRIIAGR